MIPPVKSHTVGRQTAAHPKNCAWRPIREWVDRLQKAPVTEIDHTNHASPTISIVVPTFNHAEYIGQCLDSILDQSCKGNFEILLGEDASTDSTREICLRYVRERPDVIRLFLHDERNKITINDVCTGRFNVSYLLSRARGDFICLCEGDDFWRDPAKLQTQLDAMLNAPEASIAFTDSIIVREGQLTNETFLHSSQRRDIPWNELAVGARIPTQTVMFRNVFRSHTLPSDYFQAFNGDSYLFSFLSMFGFAKYIEGIKPSAYRVHAGGIWSGLDREQQLVLSIGTKKILRGLHASPIVRKQFDEHAFRLTISLAKERARNGRVGATLNTLGQLGVTLIRQPKIHIPLTMRKLRNRLVRLLHVNGDAE